MVVEKVVGIGVLVGLLALLIRRAPSAKAVPKEMQIYEDPMTGETFATIPSGVSIPYGSVGATAAAIMEKYPNVSVIVWEAGTTGISPVPAYTYRSDAEYGAAVRGITTQEWINLYTYGTTTP